MRQAMAILGNPQNQVPAIHLAGTNGKGSTAAMIAAFLHEAGHRVGLTISPHLISLNERVQINCTPLPQDDFWDACQQVYDQLRNDLPDWDDDPLTHFEFLTAVAFWVFARQHCDWQVVETGMGGRLDATNVLAPPQVAVITSIGLDHQQFLGDTLPKIGAEKAGILKPSTGALVLAEPPAIPRDARSVFLDAAQRLAIPLAPLPSVARLGVNGDGQGGYLAHWQVGDGLAVKTRMLGGYQGDNLRLALAVARQLGVDDQHVVQALSRLVWPGRLQWLKDVGWLVDGSHNEQGWQSLVESLAEFHACAGPVPNALALAVPQSRDPTVFFKLWAASTLTRLTHILCYAPDSTEAAAFPQPYWPPDELAAFCQQTLPGCHVTSVSGVDQAMGVALGMPPPVLWTGSLYTAGHVLSRHNCPTLG